MASAFTYLQLAAWWGSIRTVQPEHDHMLFVPLLNLTVQHGCLELEATPGVRNPDGTFVIYTAVCYDSEVGQRAG